MTDWRSVGEIELLDDGLRLLPLLQFGGFEALRAIFVPWGTHRDEVLRCVEFHAPYLVKGREEGMEHGARGTEEEGSENQGARSTEADSSDS